MLSVSDIEVRIGQISLLSGVSVEAEKGDVVGIMGESGAGKTTLLNAICGVTPITRGQIICGEDWTAKPIGVRDVAYMQQDFPLYEYLTVEQNVFVSAKSKSSRKTESPDREVSQLFELFGFSESIKTRRVSSLSGGERQRVALIKALSSYSRLLLLDEPFSNLDRFTKAMIRNYIPDLIKRQSRVCLIVLHDEGDAAQIANRILLMESGQAVASGGVEEVIANKATPNMLGFGTMLGTQCFAISQLIAGGFLIPPRGFPNDALFAGWLPESVFVKNQKEHDTATTVLIEIPAKLESCLTIRDRHYMKFRAKTEKFYMAFWHASNTDHGLSLNESCILQVKEDDVSFYDEQKRITI